MSLLTAEFSRFNHRGEACGQAGGKEVLAFGVIPGETAEVRLCRKKGRKLVCLPEKILSPAADRIPPRESHYLSCSPWQTISYDSQVRFKKKMLEKAFYDFSGDTIRPQDFFPSPEKFGYRTKMEFSFALEAGRLALAFNERGSPFMKTPLPGGCSLASGGLNSAALAMVDIFNRLGLTGGELKTLTMRESKSSGKIIAGLAVKCRDTRFRSILGNKLPAAGLTVFFSDPKSPSSVVSEVLFSEGDNFLKEELSGRKFTYGIDGFFQNNIPQFEKALAIIAGNIPRSARIIELYSGAGAIGISLSGIAEKITGVEESAPGAGHAEINARENNAANFSTIRSAAEKISPSLLEEADVLIMDPPRSGAVPKLLHRIEKAAPPLVVYLSCSPAAQAADYSLLRERYRPAGLYGFDFHPQTPHIESLLFLKRR